MYFNCVLRYKCGDRYPGLAVGVSGRARQIGVTGQYLFFPHEDENLPSGISREDFCGYVIVQECLEFTVDSTS